MRPAQSPSIDFNQMLVVSVFFHFLLFTVVMFLPQTQKAVKRIIPITVDLIDIPSGPAEQPAPKLRETTPVPVADRPVPEKPKPLPKESVAHKAMMSKLDQVASLESKKKPVEKKVVHPKQPILDDTFQELEALKERSVPSEKAPPKQAPKPVENVLEGFEDLKMKARADKNAKPQTRKQIAKEDLALKELEFEQLAKKTTTARPEKKTPKSSDLLKELNDLEKMNRETRAALDQPQTAGKNRPASKSSQLVKQLESLKQEKVQIKIDHSKLSTSHSSKFKSEIRNMEMTSLQRPKASPRASGNPGDPATDVLSKYVSEIYAKVFAHWKDPLGGGTGLVQVSFTVFPKGNISTPNVLKGSGVEKLDTLAVRAVKNSAPLPPFPKELTEPNLPLIFEFTYVPSK